MKPGTFDDVTRQYGCPDPLQVRIATHRTYQERTLDLDSFAGQLLALPSGASLLDAGCGPGLFLKHIRRTGHTGRLTGLDQSPGMVAEARSVDERIDAVAGDVARLPFADNEFEAAVARHMLYHVPDIPRALAELNRVSSSRWLLSTGSRGSMPHLMGLLSSVITEFDMTPEDPVMKRFCTENAGEWLDDAGFAFDETLLDNALVFTSPEPMVAYVLSCLSSYSIAPDSALYSEMQAWLTEHVKASLDAAGGTIRDLTRVGFYVVLVE